MFLLKTSLLLLATLSILSNLTAEYHSSSYQVQNAKSTTQAADYCKTDQSASRYLAYRDIPVLIERFVQGKKALDYGAGTGISAAFLQKLGFNVTGVDISPEMLKQANTQCPSASFHLIQNNTIPFEEGIYDLVFSGWVLFELGTENEIVTYLKEAKRVMKPQGIFIAVTGSEQMFSKDWLIYGTDYPENCSPKSGGLCKVYSRDVAIEFTDYYWTETDYRRLFEQASFQLIEVYYPLGKEGEGYVWRDEKTNSPYVIFIAKPI